jgi:membrane protease YdiL (CAAX protease family)
MDTANVNTTRGASALERQPAGFGFWMATSLLLCVVGIQITLGVALMINAALCERLLHLPSHQLTRHPLVMGFNDIVEFGVVLAFGLYLNRPHFRRAFPIGRITVLQLLGVALCVLGAWVLLSNADNLLRALLPIPQWLLKLFEDLFFSKDRLLFGVFSLVIIGPVTEELLFRGIILRGLLSRYRPFTAVLLTSLLFAAFHMNPWQALGALFLGGLIGWFYLRTRSLALCVLAHALNNGWVILFALLPSDIRDMTGIPGNTAALFLPWWLNAAGAGALLAGFWIFRKATPQPPAMPEGPIAVTS